MKHIQQCPGGGDRPYQPPPPWYTPLHIIGNSTSYYWSDKRRFARLFRNQIRYNNILLSLYILVWYARFFLLNFFLYIIFSYARRDFIPKTTNHNDYPPKINSKINNNEYPCTHHREIIVFSFYALQASIEHFNRLCK